MVTEPKSLFGYYPGCELRTRAQGLDLSARRACQTLGITLQEMKNWTCCGGLVPQVRDNYMGFLAPARVLVEAHAQGFDELVTLCVFCFNTLKRASYFLQRHPDARQRVTTFLGVEKWPEVRVIHLLELLRDHVGLERLQKAVSRPLRGLRVAPYYGCFLLRPAQEIKLDDPENPTLMEGLLRALGCEVVDFPAKTDCCGSYHAVSKGEVAARLAEAILHSAVESRADILVTSCPLCQFNLDRRQALWRDSRLPVVYFPQLLALSLGEPAEALGLQEPALRALTLVPSAR